ncbi:hypothetical protein Lal_00016600 [Lupinus albus]|nr:hypothetical protein Lal_00016600 [Lupinus albus]
MVCMGLLHCIIGEEMSGEGLSANMAGMSKNQLYHIMSQMKNLIEQNQQQARHILINNPLLTKALFQAQIMLGMVQSPHVVSNVQPMVTQNTQQSVQPLQQPNVQSASLLHGQVGSQDQNQPLAVQPRKHQNQPSVPVPSAAVPAMSHQSQPLSGHSLQMPQQPKGHLTPQVPPASLPLSAQIPNITSPSLHTSSQPLHPPLPAASSQLQQPLQASGFPHMPQQPPRPQIRPPSGPPFHPQYPAQVGANLGFQHAGAPHNIPQSVFHPGTKSPASVVNTFPQEQTTLPSQQPSKSHYQVGNMPLGGDFGNQAGNAMQVDRPWMPGPSENPTQLSGPSGPPPSIVPGQMGAANQPLRPPALSPEMEKALLQQVMSLTPEQINLLPPEQRNQVLQLQQMLRQ